MKISHIILIVFFVLGASEPKAETIFFAHTVSYHVNRAANYNEINTGVGFRHYVDPGRYITAGTYKNSERSQSNYFGTGWELGKGDFKLGISAGLITGYSLGSVLPYIVPVLKYKRASLIFIAYPEAVTHLTIDLMEF